MDRNDARRGGRRRREETGKKHWVPRYVPRKVKFRVSEWKTDCAFGLANCEILNVKIAN
jgi:hypothetical protein